MAEQIDGNQSRKKSTIWNFVFLNVGFIISVINGVLIIPLYLYYIDSSVYGIWLATGNILTWITIIDPGVSSVLLQKTAYAIGKGDKKETGLIITSGVLIAIVLFLLSIIIGYGLSFFLVDIAKIDYKYQGDIILAFRIALWGTAFSLLADTFRNIILAYQKTKFHGFMLNSILVASLIVNVILLICGYGVFALAYTSLFRGGAILIFAIVYSLMLVKKNNLKFEFESQFFKSFSKIFAYTFSSRLFETVTSNIDLLIVSRFLGANAVVVLDLSRRPIKIVTGITNSLTQSMLPTLPHLYASGDVNKIKNTTLRLCNIVLWISAFIIGGFLLLNQSLINNWVGEKFWIGSENNIILCVSFFMLSIGYNFSNITLSMGDIKNNSLISIIRSIIYLILLFVLAKYFNLSGVLMAFLLSLIVMVYYYPKKVYSMAMDKESLKKMLQNVFIVSTIIITCCFISYAVTIKLSWVGLLLSGSIYTFVFFGILILFSQSFKGEIQGIIKNNLKE